MLKIKVKAGSITNLTDARYFAAREVAWLGFPVGNGDGLIEPQQVKAIAAWVDGVKIIGEFGFLSPDEIRHLHTEIGLDAVQVGMFTSLDEMKELKGLSVIKEVVASTDLPPEELQDHLEVYHRDCDYFLLNFSLGGHTWEGIKNGHPYEVGFLKNICQKYPVILHLDCSVAEVPEMVTTLNPFALSLSGGEEEKVGIKSFDDLDEILDALEIE